ncbi:YT521-B-like domain-containing protein [Mycena maculata]|uniref:YT521-B-like domain-containing protein n=1 Tax=Mycena maculata TaxID=230809 RepID=A0AAD7NT71_9AGAR|nr:YT521-B-like domain-containing protein [Mycena maculata]
MPGEDTPESQSAAPPRLGPGRWPSSQSTRSRTKPQAPRSPSSLQAHPSRPQLQTSRPQFQTSQSQLQSARSQFQPSQYWPSPPLNVPTGPLHLGFNAPLAVSSLYVPSYTGYEVERTMSQQFRNPPHFFAQSPSIHAGYPTYPTFSTPSPSHSAYSAYFSPHPAFLPSPQPMMHDGHTYLGARAPPPPFTHNLPISDPDGATWWYAPTHPLRMPNDPVPAAYLHAPSPTSHPGPSARQPLHSPHVHPPPFSFSSYLGPQTPPVGSQYDSPPQQQQQQHSLHVAPPTPLLFSPLSPIPGRKKSLARRTYHPDPPAHRSEWVMWAGNVPKDARQDELWRFFTQPPEGSGEGGPPSDPSIAGGSADGMSGEWNGVVSIFLITRSNCAFVNYTTEGMLQAAIARFDGVSLRYEDPRCHPLACRVRGTEQDLRAGVGGQRGMGLHKQWVKGEPQSRSEKESPYRSRSGSLEHDAGSSCSGASGSTTSSLLVHHFPQRFFILKSLTQGELDTSVRSGVWATQRHNEDILDRAFRTAQDVFLVLSANKSGEFYGYARMVGPVARAVHVAPAAPAPFFTPGRTVDNSPRPYMGFPSPLSTPPRPRDVQSAPPMLGKAGRAMNAGRLLAKYSLDQWLAQGDAMELDEAAPFRARRDFQGDASAEDPGPARDFKLQWLCTQHLPFQRTQHIRNPWNHDRQIKVSRDGTELEPAVGLALLQEWGVFSEAQLQESNQK